MIGIVTALLLIAIAIGLLWAVHKGRINNQFIGTLSSVAGIVAAIAAIVLFIVPPPSDNPAPPPAVASEPTHISASPTATPTVLPTEAPTATNLPPTATPSETPEPPTAAPSETPEPPTATLESPTPAPSEMTQGPWISKVKGVKLTVEKVEVVRRTENRKSLRFYLTVDNQTNGGIIIGLGNNFLVIDANGNSYKPNLDNSQWEQNVPPGIKLTGFVELENLVPNEISDIKVSFNYVLYHIGSIIIKDISIP